VGWPLLCDEDGLGPLWWGGNRRVGILVLMCSKKMKPDKNDAFWDADAFEPTDAGKRIEWMFGTMEWC